jgi:MFS family permease
VDRDDLQYYSLYLVTFASSFGFITVVTLLPTYIDLLNPSGALVGLFVSALAIARAVGLVPIAWAGDRYDKRTLLLASLAVSVLAYLVFAVIETSVGFLTARVLQGLGIVGTGLLGLALVSELAPEGQRANVIGTYNSWRMAAGILGTLGAGALYAVAGFGAVFGLLAVLLVLSFVGVGRFVPPDETTVPGFAFTDLALNRRIATMTSFRAQYAVSVTLVRNWVPIYVGVSVARGGLAASAVAVGAVVAAEKFTNMLGQPRTGRLSDRFGRAPFVAFGGTMYGLVALAVPFSPEIAAPLSFVVDLPLEVVLTPTLLVVFVLNALLGVADSFREPASMATFADEGVGSGIASSFGVRNMVWLPGSILAPIVGGVLMDGAGMQWVFFLGGATALTGVAAFLGVLTYSHGKAGITKW